jgi:hypothetical protein
MVMATVYPASQLVKDIVAEKESQQRELMFASGLRPGVNIAAWGLVGGATFTFVGGLFLIITSKTFLSHSTSSLLGLYFALFALSELTFCLLIAACFSRAKIAAIVAPSALFASLLPCYLFYGTSRYEQIGGKFSASLFSATAFAFGADVLSDYEYAGIGVTWSNFREGDFSFASSLLMMAIDAVLYLVLALYLDATLPKVCAS